MFVLDSQIASEELDNGVVRKIKGYIDDLMLVELTWKAGQEGVPIIRTVSAIMW